MKILDVGCGSGYLTACFGRMLQSAGGSGKCIGIDCVPELVSISVQNMMKRDADLLADGLVTLKPGDGWAGDESEAPFHAIHVGAGAESIPEKLVEQLADGGRMVCPVDNDFIGQDLLLISKDAGGNVTQKSLMGVLFVPLVLKPAPLSETVALEQQ